MSGIIVGNIPGITRLRIDSGEAEGFLASFDEKIRTRAFRDFFPENAEKNAGFVSINDCLDADFTVEKTLLGDYRVFSVRVDRRKVPASSIKIRLLEERKKHLQETGQKQLTKMQRETLRESVRAELLKNIPPVTAVYDVAINTVSGTVYVSALAIKAIQEFMDIFREAFEISLHLYEVVSLSQEDLNKVSPMTIGRDFMTWLWFKSHQQEGLIPINGRDYAIEFVRRIALESGEGDTTETVVCSGMNFDLNEAKEALRQGKKIKEARLVIETDDGTVWEFGYKGDSFQFQSVKLPTTAEIAENETPEGRNLERLFVMTAMIDVMDELFKMYLRLRISPEWAHELARMVAWAEEE